VAMFSRLFGGKWAAAKTDERCMKCGQGFSSLYQVFGMAKSPGDVVRPSSVAAATCALPAFVCPQCAGILCFGCAPKRGVPLCPLCQCEMTGRPANDFLLYGGTAGPRYARTSGCIGRLWRCSIGWFKGALRMAASVGRPRRRPAGLARFTCQPSGTPPSSRGRTAPAAKHQGTPGEPGAAATSARLPESTTDWLSQVSSRPIPLEERVQLAYALSGEDEERMTEEFLKVLCDDAPLRSAIIAKYEADKRASTNRTGVCDRLVLWPEECAIKARNELARQALPENPAELSDRDLGALEPAELAKLVAGAKPDRADFTLRRVLKATDCGGGRRVVARLLDTDSEDRALSRGVFRVLTQMWGEDDEGGGRRAAGILYGLGGDIDTRSYRHQQWFKDAAAGLIAVAISMCESAELRDGTQPLAPRVLQAVNLLSRLADSTAVPVLESLAGRLRHEIAVRGDLKQHVSDGFVAGWRSNKDHLRHIDSTILEIARRAKNTTPPNAAPAVRRANQDSFADFVRARERGDMGAAMRALEETLDLAPGNAQALAFLGTVYCPKCARCVSWRCLSGIEKKRFWSGHCPKCETPTTFRDA